MKTILASVYAVNPYKGSEDGTGWNLILQIARFNKVIAITRENNKPDIEKYFATHKVNDAGNISFEYYDLPYWMRFWKKGSRGALLYYYMWQIGLPGFIRKKKLSFDIVHNLNFHNDWAASFLWRFHKPFVWGPVGHHPRVPAGFLLPVYGLKKWLADGFRWKLKKLFWKTDPFLNYTIRKADKVLVINTEARSVLGSSADKFVLMPAVATDDMRGALSEPDCFNIISVGRFIALKGFDVTVRSFAAFTERLPDEERAGVKLILVGSGPELGYLESLITDLKMSQHVRIIPWVRRDEMNRLYADSKIFLFPSHEGAGMVVPEALSCGLPVVCFDNAGPGEFIHSECGIKIPYGPYEESILHFATALWNLYENPSFLQKLSAGARKQFEDKFQWNRKGDMLKSIYNEISENEETGS